MSRSIFLLLLATPGLLAACSHPAPPASPAADATTPAAATSGATDLSRSIHKPIDKAKGVEGTVEKSFENQNRQLDAAEGASASQAASP